MVVTKDRGRWGVILDAPDDSGRARSGSHPGPPDSVQQPIVCMRARELGRTNIVVGDRVGVVGDTSGKEGTLARIVKVADRTSVLRRTADDTDPYERIVVANADQLLIVSAVADPPPRSGFVERTLIAAFVGGLTPILCLTKTDLADPTPFASEFADLDVQVVLCGIDDDLAAIDSVVRGHITALIGHSGVGKSTLVNRLVPDANRATGAVSGVGKGRHTSTQSVALRLPDTRSDGAEETVASGENHPIHGSGWIIDTPGVRSFGLAHVQPDTVLGVFDDLAELIEDCPRGCTHLGPPADPECALDTATGATARRVTAVRKLLVALRSNEDWEVDRV